MVQCENCKFDNYDGTQYCQRCGERLHTKFHLDSEHLKSFIGVNLNDVSFAPAALIAIDGQRQQANLEMGNSPSRITTPVLPLDDGSWFCPDCGDFNLKNALFCKGCGRDL